MYLENFHAKLDWRLPILFLLLLVPVAYSNFALFHTIVELVAVIVGILAFVVAFNTYPFSQFHYLMFLGCGYFWVGILDLFHTLTYSPINIFSGFPDDASVKFWVFARFLEVGILLSFTEFIYRKVQRIQLFLTFAVIAMACVWLISLNVLPAFKTPEVGLTPAKFTCEYIIIILLGLSAWRMRTLRPRMNKSIYWLFVWSILLTIAAEITFLFTGAYWQFYVSLGHIFKLLSFWLIYVALVESALTQPFKSLSLSSDTFNALPEVIVVVNDKGEILHANDTARHFGESARNQLPIVGADVHSRFHDSRVSPAFCDICQAIKRQQTIVSHEVQLGHKWYEISLSTINYFGQQDVMLHVCRDITVIKEAQLNYQTADRLYTVLRLTNKAIICSKTKQELLDSVCNIAVNHGGFAMAWIGMLQGQDVVPVSSHGDCDTYLESIVVRLDGSELSRGPVGIAIEGNTVTYVNNIDEDPSFRPWRDAAMKRGYKSMAAIPVMQFERCIGIFVIYSAAYDAFDSQIIELLESLSDDISSVVSYIKAEEQRMAAEAKLRQLSLAIEQSESAIMITDMEGQIEYVNHYFTELTDYSEHHALGLNVRDFNRLEETKVQLEQCFNQVTQGKPWKADVKSLTRTGKQFWSKESVSPLVDSDGNLLNIVWTMEDNTELHEAQQTISQLAYFDALTGLPNRRLYYDRFNQAIVAAKRHRTKLAVFYFDLDNFKMVNDSWGHDFGDLLLKHVAKTLTEAVREMDTVSRLGGDEFSLIINDVQDEKHIVHVADNILQQLNKKIDLAGRELTIATSIGISIYPEDGEDAKELMKNADMAMYHAKEKGKNNFQFFEEFLNINAQQRLDMETRIQYALDNDQFQLYYQPQFDINTRVICGVEVLIRWPDGKGGFVSPGEFIPIAEETSLIIDIGNWVVRTACCEFKQLIDDGLPAVKVAVNISANQFKQSRLLKRTIVAALEESQLPHELLQLEITEGVLIDDVDETISVIDELKAQNITFAIDDFGTGYSSLSYLKTFAVDLIKIDRSFINDIENDPNDQAIIRAISVMAHELELKVLAEGVENEAQLQFLRQHQCDFLQGFYFAKPMPASDLIARFGTELEV